MKALHYITLVLVVIGGLDWGITGLGEWAGANWNVVNLIFGSWPWLEALIYVLVGLSTIWLIIKHKHDCKTCSMGGSAM